VKPGDLRRFRDSPSASIAAFEGSTFVVLRVNVVLQGRAEYRTVDILIDGGLEEGLGYFWVEDSSEPVNEAG